MFEKVLKQRRALVFFAVIYLIFGSAFFYLLFMTPGLEFIQEETEGKMRVFLFNNSSHVINSIEVETDFGEKIASVEQLAPQEKALLQLEGRSGAVKLVARAPFHAAASRVFSFVEGGETEEVKLSYKVTAPSIVFVDLNFVTRIEVCNEGGELSEVSLEERHGKTFFKEESRVETISLVGGECKEISFTLTPAKTGRTKIYFNVKALSYSREIEKEITIEE